MKIKYELKNKDTAEFLFDLANRYGIETSRGGPFNLASYSNYNFNIIVFHSNYPVLKDLKFGIVAQNSIVSNNSKSVTLEEFIDAIVNYKKELELVVTLNETNKAIVTKSGIKVGCQEFSFDAAYKLIEAVKQIEKSEK